ncbi:MAG: OmpH family outer membrane protein [Pseudomonadota bacterium]
MLTRKLAFVVCATVFAAFVGQTAAAQNKVVVIDQAQIMRDSRAGKDIAAKLKAIGDTMATELQPVADALSTEQQSLNAQTSTLTREALAQNQQLVTRIESFSKRAQDFEVKRQRSAVELEQTRRQAWGKFFEALGPALTQVVTDRGADVVLDRSSVVYSDKSVDVTIEVIARIDATTPTIEVVKAVLPQQPAPQ